MNYDLEIKKKELEVRRLQRKIEHLKTIQLLKRCEVVLKLAKWDAIEGIPNSENYYMFCKNSVFRGNGNKKIITAEERSLILNKINKCKTLCNSYYRDRTIKLSEFAPEFELLFRGR